MSKRCPDCRFVNEDSRIFCASCGAPLDAQLRLIQDLEKQKEAPKAPPPDRQRGEINISRSHTSAPEKKSGATPWIILGLIAVIAAAAWFMLK